MKGIIWKCDKCGYELPKESDLLKICPGCGVLGEFVRIRKSDKIELCLICKKRMYVGEEYQVYSPSKTLVGHVHKKCLNNSKAGNWIVADWFPLNQLVIEKRETQ